MYNLKLEIVQKYLSGTQMRDIVNLYGVSKYDVYVWAKSYLECGSDSLGRFDRQTIVPEQRMEIVREHYEKGLSLSDTCVKYGINRSTLVGWCEIAKRRGYEALLKPYCKKRETGNMGRPRKKTLEEMTELERLRYENEYLKAENALLKKVKALVEEREARLKGTGQKPSKN